MIPIDIDRRPLTDDEMALAHAEIGCPPARYRAVSTPMDFEPAWYRAAQIDTASRMEVAPIEEDRPDRAMEMLTAALLAVVIAAISVIAFVKP